MTWIVSDSEGERREKGEENENGLAVFDLPVGDNEKVIVNCIMVGMMMTVVISMVTMMMMAKKPRMAKPSLTSLLETMRR